MALIPDIASNAIDPAGQAELDKQMAPSEAISASNSAAHEQAQKNAQPPTPTPPVQAVPPPTPPQLDPAVAPPAVATPAPMGDNTLPASASPPSANDGPPPPPYDAALIAANKNAEAAEKALANKAEIDGKSTLKVANEKDGKAKMKAYTATAQEKVVKQQAITPAPPPNSKAAQLEAQRATFRQQHDGVLNTAMSDLQKHLATKAAAATVAHEASTAASLASSANEGKTKAKVAAAAASDAVQLGNHNVDEDEQKTATLEHSVEAAALQLNHTKTYLTDAQDRFNKENHTVHVMTYTLAELQSNLTNETDVKAEANAKNVKAAAEYQAANDTLAKAQASKQEADDHFEKALAEGDSTIPAKRKMRADADKAVLVATHRRDQTKTLHDKESREYAERHAKVDATNLAIKDGETALQAAKDMVPKLQAKVYAAEQHLPVAQMALDTATKEQQSWMNKIASDTERVVKQKAKMDASEELSMKASKKAEDANANVVAAQAMAANAQAAATAARSASASSNASAAFANDQSPDDRSSTVELGEDGLDSPGLIDLNIE